MPEQDNDLHWMRACRLLTVLLLCSAVAASNSGAASHEQRRLNVTMDGWFAWRGTPGQLCASYHAPELVVNSSAPCRFWRQADLRRLRNVAHYDALRPLFSKLHAGLPITVAAFGSSITSNAGGCFHADIDTFRARLGGAVPLNFIGNKLRSLCAFDSPYRAGFATQLMAAINKTWPHAGHTLVNVGGGALTLSSFVHHKCLDELTPPDVDLFLFEQYQWERHAASLDERPGSEAELLYRQLLSRPGISANMSTDDAITRVTPLVLLHFVEAVEAGSPSAACVENWGAKCATLCASGAGGFKHSATPAARVAREEQLDVMAHYYGWSSFSVRNFVWSALRDGVHTALGLSECEFMGALFTDHIHPTLLGAWLLADAMIQHFVDAQAYFELQDVDGVAVVPLRLPTKALTLAGGSPAPARTCVAAASLVVTASRAWAFAATEVVRNKTVHKPGWISVAPDAYLEVDLSTVLAWPLPGNSRVTLVYLRSYDSAMGAAAVTCTNSCSCDAAVLDARCEEHVSLHQSHTIDVRAIEGDPLVASNSKHGDACKLRLDVVNATAAVGWKFKLLGVSVV